MMPMQLSSLLLSSSSLSSLSPSSSLMPFRRANLNGRHDLMEVASFLVFMLDGIGIGVGSMGW